MKEDNNTKAARMKRGDTLDYYNDSLPKKAVESLFEKDDNPPNNFISGFEDETPEYNTRGEVVIQDRLSFKDKSRRAASAGPDDNLEDNIAMYSKQNTRPRKDFQLEEKYRQNTGQRQNSDEEYDDTPSARPGAAAGGGRAAYGRERPTVRGGRAAEYEPDTHAEPRYSDVEDDMDYDNEGPYDEIKELKQRPRQNTRPRDYDEYEEAPAPPPRRRPTGDTAPRRRSSGDTSPRRGDYGSRLPGGQADGEHMESEPRRGATRPALGGGTNPRQSAQERINARAESRAGGGYTSPRAGTNDLSSRRYPGGAGTARRTQAASRLFDEENDSESPIPIKVVIFGVAGLAVLALFVFLIIRINTLNGDLAEALKAADTLSTLQDNYAQLQIQVDSLNGEKEHLESRIKEYEALYAEPPEDNGQAGTNPDGTSPNDNDPVTIPPVNQPGPTTPTNPNRVYTVKSGDNLSRIAQAYYGSSSAANVQKIKDANNLTNDNINIGDTLVIPE